MKEIDVSKWDRKAQYDYFGKYTDPIFSLGAHLDVTGLIAYCKEKNRSFFPSFLYIVTESINKVEQFRTRIVGDKVVSFDVTHPSYVVIRDDESIVACITTANSDYNAFYESVKKDIAEAKECDASAFSKERRLDCIYISCLPWVDFTSMKNPYNYKDAEQTSIPRITWGKYVEKDGRYSMAFDLAAHHAFADGLHAAKLFNNIQAMLDDPTKYLGG